MFNFKKRTCILYHLAFLDWLNARNFLSPSTRFQPLKSHFLTTILPFSAMFLMSLKGFVYTIAVDVYAFCLAFSTILPCIQHHFALCFAPKRTVFCTKTQCIQRQMAQNLVQMAVFLNKNSFHRIHKLPPFCIKTNLRENRFFAARRAVGEREGHS